LNKIQHEATHGKDVLIRPILGGTLQDVQCCSTPEIQMIQDTSRKKRENANPGTAGAKQEKMIRQREKEID